MKFPFTFNKFLAMARCLTNSGNPAGQAGNQEPVAIAADPSGILYVRQASGPSNQTQVATSNPGAGAQATATLAATPGKAWNALSIVASYGDSAAATGRTLVLRDGASGVGAIIWQTVLGPLAAGTSQNVNVTFPPGFGIYGTSGNAMTLEFTAAPAATGTESVALTGYTSL